MFEPNPIITHIVQATDPTRAMQQQWPASLHSAERITIMAAGKAAHTMTHAALERCANRVTGGVAAVLPSKVPQMSAPFTVYPAAHPFPDERNLKAAQAMIDTAQHLTAEDTLLLLLSGGGSAMMASPAEGITLGDLQGLTRALMHAGASIDELNAVRKHCETLKGGGLARLAHPARVVALILSDVVGDRVDVIASGPVTADPTTIADALDILRHYDLLDDAPSITAHLHMQSTSETLKPGDARLKNVETHIIGSNADAIEAARTALTQQGLEVVHIAHEVTGEARDVGRRLGKAMLSLQPGQAIIYGGETTVTVRGSGRGGRNQEMALAAAITLKGHDDVYALTFATDGIDGPTDAAGAHIDGHTHAQMQAAGIDPIAALANNDSHTALAAVKALIRTGPTGTNVNDVAIGLRLG